MESFKVGDEVDVRNFMGKTIHKTKVSEITPGGNIRVEWKNAYFVLMAMKGGNICFGLTDYIL